MSDEPSQGIGKPGERLAEAEGEIDARADRVQVLGVAMLGTLLGLCVASCGWLIFDLTVVNPIKAANFLPCVLPTIWPLPALVATPVVGGLVWLILSKVPALGHIANRIPSLALLTAVLTLYVLAWPLILILNMGQG